MLPNWLHSDRNKILLGIFIVFSLITSYVYQFSFFQNCINIKPHFISYLLLGAVIGIGLAYYLGRELHFLIEKVQLVVAGAFAGMILIPLLLTLMNRMIQISAPTMTDVEILRVDEYSQSRFGELELSKTIDGYYVYFIVEKKPFRLSVAPDFDVVNNNTGSILPIEIHHGLLGLKWVKLPTQ